MNLRIISFAVFVLLASGCSEKDSAESVLPAISADTIYTGGNIITINDEQPDAEAVAVKDGKIVAVGKKDEVMKTAGENTRQVDLAGKTMLPGFVDAHGHAYAIGLQASTANLLPAPDGSGNSVADIQKLLEDWASNNKAVVERVGWIAGFGYDDSQLAEKRHPNRDDLDKVSTEIPIIIIHQSGHLGVANSKALEIAGVTSETQNPKGGAFRRKPNSNEPNGVCEEYAFFYVLTKLAARFDEKINDALVLSGTRLLASYGYTTGQDGRSTGPGIEAMRRVAASGKLDIDLVSYPDILEVDDIQPAMSYTDGFRIGGAKLTIDGSPQGKTAWLTKPYHVPPPGQDKDYRGYAAVNQQTVNQATEKAFAHGWQILIHANGDAAIDSMISAVRAARQKHPDVQNRPVLIHGQTLRQDQVGQLKEL
ncbi:MAG: amidohydrolase, partial [Thiohalophilus sp.]